MTYFVYIFLIGIFNVSFASTHFEHEWKLKTSDNYSLYIKEVGVGDPVIVVHGGWGIEHSYLRPLVKSFNSKYRFVFYDMRGSLRSKKFSGKVQPEMTYQKHVSDLNEIFKNLKKKKVTLIAHSMGAFVALEFAKQFPESIDKILFISPIPLKGSLAEMQSVSEQAANRCNKDGVTRELHQLNIVTEIRSCRGENSLTDRDRGFVHRVTQAAINLNDISKWRELEGLFYYEQKAGVAALESMPPDWDYSKTMQTLNKKVIVAIGKDDYLPFSWGQRWKKVGVETLLIEDAGHIPWVDQPQKLNQILESFL